MVGNEIVMKTNISAHMSKFEWAIQNGIKTSKPIFSEKFSLKPECKTKLRSAMDIKKRCGSLTISIGFQRMDKCKGEITMITILRLCNSKGAVYFRRASKFTCGKDNKIHYCISGKFSTDLQKPRIKQDHQTTSDTDVDSSKKRSQSSIDSGSDKVFRLNGDLLLVKGYLKIYGCCIFSNQVSECKSLAKLTELKAVELANESVQEAINDFKFAYESNLFTDVTLNVEGFNVRAHKFVLCARCPYFRNQLYGAGSPDVIDIVDIDKRVLDCLLRYLYTGTVGSVRLDTIRELYKAADKYEVYSLKKNCSSVMKSYVDDTNACDMLKLADLHKDIDLKNFILNYVVDHFDKIDIIHNFTFVLKTNPELAAEVLQIKSLKRR